MRRIAVLLAGMLFMAVGATSASAHADLVSMTPASGSTVAEALPQVVLTFGEDISGMGSSVVVLDPNGEAMQFTVTFTGRNAVVDLIPFIATGEYHVNYRINSADGHVIEGSEAFTYDGPTETPTPTAVATIAGGGDEDGEAESGEGLEGGGGMIGLVSLAIIVIGGIAYLISIRKKQG